MVDALDITQASLICDFLTPKETLRVRNASTSSLLARASGTESLWAAHARRIFGEGISDSGCVDPAGKEADSWRENFALWNRVARDVGLPPPATVTHADRPLPQPRWIAAWGRVRKWLNSQCATATLTLRPGLAAKDFPKHALLADAVPEVLDLWRVFDGQNHPDRDQANVEGWFQRDWPTGLYGGYAAYDHEVSTVLLPLDSVLTLTAFVRDRIPVVKERFPKCIAFACSPKFAKIMFVDVQTGAVFSWTRNRPPFLEPAVSGGRDSDGLLRWMEQYAYRLEAGVYILRPLRPELPEDTMGICLVPATGPHLTRCVTRGVEVIAAWVYMAEHQMGWTYSITLRLAADKAERGYDTCQLESRQWVIQLEGGSTDRVEGQGVIGLFPILCDGGWILSRESDPHNIYQGKSLPQQLDGEFRYQSCSGRQSSRVTFGGDFTFVPGTIKKPTGPKFKVRVEPFVLQVPDFIY